MHPHLVIDLETMGTTPGCEILEIGACAFGGPGPASRFSVLIGTPEVQRRGVTAPTVEWWKQQEFYLPDIARAEGVPALHALLRFQGWFTAVADKDTRVWGNSPSFDCAILREAFEYRGLQAPWDFRMERDVRTLRDCLPLMPILHPREVLPKHRALMDAMYEAAWVATTLGLPFDVGI